MLSNLQGLLHQNEIRQEFEETVTQNRFSNYCTEHAHVKMKPNTQTYILIHNRENINWITSVCVREGGRETEKRLIESKKKMRKEEEGKQRVFF